MGDRRNFLQGNQCPSLSNAILSAQYPALPNLNHTPVTVLSTNTAIVLFLYI